LTEYELALLGPLCSKAVRDGWALLPVELASLRVRLIAEYTDNYGSIEFEARRGLGGTPPVMVADGRAFDEDGVPIEYLLFLKLYDGRGLPHELEVSKMDGTPIKRFPVASDLDCS
jgi:hypothetical protein